MSAAVVARVRGLMKAQGLTQKDLSERSGVDQTYVSRMFRAPTRISVDTLVRLSDALRVAPADLLPGRPVPQVDTQAVALQQIGAELANMMDKFADLSERVAHAIAAPPHASPKRSARKR